MTNFIQRTSGCLSEKDCNAVIDYFEIDKEKHVAGVVGAEYKLDPKRKLDTEMAISLNELIQDSRLNPVAKALQTACEEYIKNYPFLKKLTYWEVFSYFTLKKYNPNEAYFAEHCENDGGVNGVCEKRLIAVMVYLNTVTDGGQTHFPTQNISFSPKVGDILMWPAYWTHPHHGIPSPSQVKYIITGWYSFNDQQA